MTLQSPSLKSPLAELVGLEEIDDTDPALVQRLNATEIRLAELGIPARGYAVGTLPVVFSRQERRDFPDQEYLSQGGRIRRLLDQPAVTAELIALTTQHVQARLQQILREHPTHVFSRARLPHSRNIHRHLRQSATCLSYVMRAFCPEETPALFPLPETDIYEEDIQRLILSLPIDPERISDETLQKMDLTPPDYDTYTAQARLRYKLWIRHRFLHILAHAHVFERKPTLTAPGKSTARLISFRTEKGRSKVAVFGTSTDMYDHVTGGEHPRHQRKKVSDTSFRILADMPSLLRSQEHALVQLLQKGESVTEYLTLFERYGQMTTETRCELVCDAFRYFSQKRGYHGDKIVDFLKKLPKSPSMVGNINVTLRQLIEDIRGKINEIDTTYRLLLAKWDTLGKPRI